MTSGALSVKKREMHLRTKMPARYLCVAFALFMQTLCTNHVHHLYGRACHSSIIFYYNIYKYHMYIYILYSCTRTRLHTNTIKYISFIWILQRKLCHAFSWGVCVLPWKRCYCIYCLVSLQPGSVPILWVAWVAHVPSTCSQIHGSNNWSPAKVLRYVPWMVLERYTHGPNFQDAISISCPLGIYMYIYILYIL